MAILSDEKFLYRYKTKIWYNKFMDEKRKLKVIDRTDDVLDEVVEEQSKPKIQHPNQTNPIYKNLAKFINSQIGDKLSVKDLLR